MHIMKAFYYKSADILKEFIKLIPDVELTNAKGYFGRVVKDGEKVVTIRLSKHNLDVRHFEDEDIFDLVDTIAHEFAHIEYIGHSEDHKKLTIAYRKLILLQLLMEEIFSSKELATDDKFYTESVINHL